ncbi:hypothetical protein [Agromyces allii]|uniref:Flagellar protein FlgA n=1 Tax=Agromyces allii TaxID=393607 RepID=A0ABP5BFS2_9MICO|nr:hypothetical protein [Agromyces allii]
MPRRTERGSIRIDPRLIIGVVLIVGSTVGVYTLVSGLDDATEVYTATETFTPGDRILESDLVVERVRFGAADVRYLEPDALTDGGLLVTSTIRQGELVPLGAVDEVDRAGLATVVVPSRGALPEGVVRGTVVDVWSARRLDRGDSAPPTVLVPEAEVAAVIDSGGMVDGDSRSVELLVPRERVAALLQALAAEDAIDLVPARPEADR